MQRRTRFFCQFKKPFMPRSAILVFVIGILLAAACRKSQNAPDIPKTQNIPDAPVYTSPSSFLAPLQGQWQWIQQTRSKDVFGTPEAIVTAASLGITEFLYMNADLTWSLISNGQTTRSGTYKVDTLLTPEGYLPALDFVYVGKDSPVNHWLSQAGDTLLTSNMRMDSTFNLDTYVRYYGDN